MRNRRRILWGVQASINRYQEVLESLVVLEDAGVKTEGLGETVLQRFLEKRDDVRRLLEDVFLRGSTRVVRMLGKKKIKIGKVKDKKALEFLLRQQHDYVRKLGEDADKIVRKTLAEAVENGWSNTRTSEELKARVKSLSRSRAEVIARSEIVKAHNYGMIETFHENGIREYEWLAKIDSRTCPVCRGLHHNVFKVGEGPLPVKDTHPNCRCTLVARV